MDPFWEWCWRRFGRRYSWAIFIALTVALSPSSLAAMLIVLRFANSDRYGLALGFTMAMTLVAAALYVLPGSAAWATVERWNPDDPSSSAAALADTYAFGRRGVRRAVISWSITYGAAAGVGSGPIGGALAGSPQWVLAGAVLGATHGLGVAHFWTEAALRPVRRGIAGDSSIGDHLPRSRPSFGTWMAIVVLAAAWNVSAAGILVSTVFGVNDSPGLSVVIGAILTAVFVFPLAIGLVLHPSTQPIRDLAAGTRRVLAGDFTERLPVVQDDDLGALTASFNLMQAGLAERERLQAAFGSYVDPSLARRLLAQGDDLFSGERVDVTLMFVDIRGFTQFAESNTAETTVAHLNAIFEIVVATTNTHGGHVNKFLGDGAMVVFGAPERINDHADQAVAAALDIQQQIQDHLVGSTRVGIGINTGTVIAGTIGGAGKLEFTLIGDAVNVAARVEQLTKETGDPILLTEATAGALTNRPAPLHNRGAYVLKGKSEPVEVHAINPFDSAPV